MAIHQEPETVGAVTSRKKVPWQRLLRTLHGWLGIVIFPLVFIAGMTGLYMNHGKQLRSLFAPTEWMAATTQTINAEAVSKDQAIDLAQQIWGADVRFRYIKEQTAYGHPSYVIKKRGRYGKLFVAKGTGRYVLKSRYIKRTYTPDDELIGFKVYWRAVMKGLHTGIIAGTPGRYAMDALSICLVLFSMSGVYLWATPRLKRFFRRRQQSPVAG